MSLLGSIAATLSEGIGGGMMANAKWGEEYEAQAKKEAADNARLQEHLKRYDADRESRDKYYAALMDESKAERAARAEQAAADRENAWRIANIRANSGGGGSNADELRGLRFVAGEVERYDTQLGNLYKLLGSTEDPTEKLQIMEQIKETSGFRKSFVTNPGTLKILDESGSFGQAYKSTLFADEQDSGSGSGNETPGASTNPAPKGIAAPSRPVVPQLSQQDIYTGQKQEYPSSKDFTNPQVGTSDVTSKYLYRQGGTTAADAANAVLKLGYHLPSAY